MNTTFTPTQFDRYKRRQRAHQMVKDYYTIETMVMQSAARPCIKLRNISSDQQNTEQVKYLTHAVQRISKYISNYDQLKNHSKNLEKSHLAAHEDHCYLRTILKQDNISTSTKTLYKTTLYYNQAYGKHIKFQNRTTVADGKKCKEIIQQTYQHMKNDTDKNDCKLSQEFFNCHQVSEEVTSSRLSFLSTFNYRKKQQWNTSTYATCVKKDNCIKMVVKLKKKVNTVKAAIKHLQNDINSITTENKRLVKKLVHEKAIHSNIKNMTNQDKIGLNTEHIKSKRYQIDQLIFKIRTLADDINKYERLLRKEEVIEEAALIQYPLALNNGSVTAVCRSDKLFSVSELPPKS